MHYELCAPHKLYNYNYRHILVLEDDISNIILSKLKSLSSSILIDTALVFPLLVRAYFLNLFRSFATHKTVISYINNISTLKP